jgi:TatD DNase family protein
MELIDIGVNLAHDSFDADRDDVIARGRAAGVTEMVLTGSSLESNDRAAAICAVRSHLYSTAGVHPHHASEYTRQTTERLLEQIGAPSVVAVGECGLDYFRNYSSPAEQRSAFAAQLDIAIESGLPVFLHQRDAHDDFVSILKPRLPSLSRAVAHCFTGGERELDEYLGLGLYIGITGWICDERRGHHLHDIVGRIPGDRMMIESDAPYLLPRSIRPRPKTRRNEPMWLPEVARCIAEATGESIEAVAGRSTRTARAFFALPTG